MSAFLLVVAVRVVGLPAPGVFAHARQIIFSNPAQLFARLVASSVVGGNVTRATRADLVRKLLAACLFEGVDNVKNRRAGAGAQVEDGNTGAGAVFGAGAFDGAKADGLAVPTLPPM